MPDAGGLGKDSPREILPPPPSFEWDLSVPVEDIPDCRMLVDAPIADTRGWFQRCSGLGLELGIPIIAQVNASWSKRGTIRGMHFQKVRPQGKHVRVLQGRILDVCLDLRPWSPTFMRWGAAVLTAARGESLYLPPGTAHGFYAYEDSLVLYACTTKYRPESDAGIYYADERLGIRWPEEEGVPHILSGKDVALPTLAEFLMDPPWREKVDLHA